MKSAFHHIPTPVFALDLTTRTLEAYNRGAIKLIGSVPRALSEALPSEAGAELERQARRASRSGLMISYTRALAWTPHQGSPSEPTSPSPLTELSLSAEVGQPRVIISLHTPTKVRSLADEELRTSTFLQQLIDLTHTLFFVADLEQHITFANRAFWDHVTLALNEPQRSGAAHQLFKLTSLTSTQVSDQLVEHLGRCVTSGAPRQLQLSWPSARGKNRIFQALMQPLISQSGRAEQVLVLCSEITELIDAYEEQRTLQLALDQAQRLESIGQMAGNIAHDFNGFLTVIISSLNLIEVETLDAESQELLQGMSEVCYQARQLIKDLLSFSRAQVISEQKGSLERLNHQLSFALPRLSAAYAKVHYHSEVTHLHTLPLSESQCAQVFVNLVNNAIEAMPHDRGSSGEVHVRCTADERSAYWEVSDNGAGIPPQLLEEIFEPFFTTKRDRGGTGLGLASARSLIMKAGGDLSVDSTLEVGTTFKIRLPAVSPEES